MDQQDQLLAVKLEQLRQDIQDGLNSGEPTPWNPEEMKQEGRKRLSKDSSKPLELAGIVTDAPRGAAEHAEDF